MPQTMEAPPRVERQVQAPMMIRAAETRPSSYSEEDNSIEIVWSTGAAVTRFDWYDGEYYDETLSLDDGAVRLDRLNNGAPFLRDHRQSVGSVLGSVVRGSAKIADGKGVARVRLSTAADVADDVLKIREGHVSTVSVGYAVYEYQVREPGEGRRKEMRAVDWEPQEVSAVAVPADPDAVIRAQRDARQGGFPCTIRGAAAHHEDRTMSDPTPNPAPAPAPTPAPAPAPTPEPKSDPAPEPQERGAVTVTVKRIRELATRSGLSSDAALELLERHEGTPLTEAQLTDAMTDAFAKARALPPINSAITFGVDETDKYRAALAGAFAVRMTDSQEKPKDGGELFGHMSAMEIARRSLERVGVKGVAMMGPMQVATEALGLRHGAMTTSDFSLALQQAGNVVILEGYEQADDNWRPLVKEVSSNDFRPTPLVGLSGTPEFLVVQENGEYTYASFADLGDSYKLWTAGRIVSLSRQLIINDQLGLFGDLAGKLGEGAKLHESNSVWANILGNPVLARDNTPLFHASHGNLGTGAAISTASLGIARQSMRQQKDLDGTTPIKVVPKFLVVGPAKETEAETALTAVAATASAGVNLFSGKLQLIVEERIVDNSWYIFADPKKAPAVVVSYLRGQKGIFTETRVGFEVDGIEHKGRIDFSAKGFDYRGAYKNPGN